MRSIGKFLLFIITFVISVGVVVGTISLFLNKAGFLDINDKIAKVPFLEEFIVEETHKNNIESKFDNYEKELAEKNDLISVQELTIKKLESDLDSLTNDYKLLEKEVDDANKSKLEESADNSDIVKHYNSMKEKKVAEIFNTMQNEQVVNILCQMDPEKVPKVLENMEVQKVSKITELFLKLNNGKI